MKKILAALLFINSALSCAASVQEQIDQDPKVKAVIEEMVIANHILYDQNAVDEIGRAHV